jgi:para-nitrobenzyl esterase
MPNVFADGVVIPDGEPLALLARADGHAAVPVMLGTNRDENKTFMLNDDEHVRRFTPLYMRLRDPERYHALAQALSLAWKVSGADAPATALAASGSEVYVYRFDWDEEPTVFGADLGAMLGAGHGLEIPFVFGHFVLGRQSRVLFPEQTKATREQLAHQMMGYWAAFARNGRPGQGRGGAMPEWKPFGAGEGAPSFMVFDTAKGGGVRLAHGRVDMKTVVASVLADARLHDSEARCAVLHELRLSAGDREARDKIDAVCKQLKVANAD